MLKNSKAMNTLYCGLNIDICGSIFHCKSAKEIWDYLYYLCVTNKKILDFEKSKIEFL